jgi:argininosuccinate lyase
VAKELGFTELSRNSLDAVASRDLVMEFLSCGAIMAVHLSRMAEDIILWCSAEFNLAQLPDSLTTSSSMMPQKKNPDGAELIRGKTGRMIGNLVTLLTVVKGLPMSYNRDLQEDKEPLFDAAETLELILPLAIALIKGLKFNEPRLNELADDPYTAATDLADHLVLRGVPFRQAHKQVGALVAYCHKNNLGLRDVSEKVLQKFCPQAQPEILSRLTLTDLLGGRDKTPGGTAPKAVALELKKVLAELAQETELLKAGGNL